MARIPGVRAWITERRWIVALLAGGLVVRLALAALLVEAARLARAARREPLSDAAILEELRGCSSVG
jgi:hypothetical protein